MRKFSDWIANHSLIILIISLILCIPATIGYMNTRVNYDMLVYLPDNIETVEGQNILTDDFGIGAFSFVMTNDENSEQIAALEKKIKTIDGVNKVISVEDVTDTTIPISILPEDVIDKVTNGNETLILVTFKDSTSSDSSIEAIRELRDVVGDANSVSGMTAMVLDTMDLADKEVFTYVLLAVILVAIVLIFATDSYLIPLFLLGNIGIAIMYNMGTNVFLGQISYITKAISAVLQLGVTMDFSIFLYHKYEEKKQTETDKKVAMAKAIRATFSSVIGSSFTTIAGFLALCTMELTLGKDIGIVMAKGVFMGLASVLTVFPSLLLLFDKGVEKTKHKSLFPKFKGLQSFAIKYATPIIVCCCLLLIPAVYGNNHVKVYYKLDNSLPTTLPCRIANSKLASDYNIVSPEVIIVKKSMSSSDLSSMVSELKAVDGIDLVLAPGEIESKGLPSDMLPEDITEVYSSDKYQLVILNSTYEVASNELSDQLSTVNSIAKKYDDSAITAGEGALTNDLVTIANHDFNMVNYISIAVIFVIMLIVLKSISLPILLVLVIELAICTNMAVAYYTGTSLPFVANIVIGTVQLGATIDYGILMSNTYLYQRTKEKDKKKAMQQTLATTIPSIVVSALCFFAATYGVALYSKIDMIGSLCRLLSRGALISMLVVSILLPSLLMVFDKVIMKTTRGMKGKVQYEK